jgi:hypothetical protein
MKVQFRLFLGTMIAFCLMLVAAAAAHAQSAGGSIHPPGWGRPAPLTFGVAPTVPTMAMFDSVDLSQIPADAPAVLGYAGGQWPTFSKLRLQWPKAHAISTAISASEYAECLDIEPGDAQPYQAPSWIRADERAGYTKPCLYSSWYEFTRQVIPILLAAHISRDEVWEIDADYTNVPHIDAGFDGTQWTDRALGRNLDESLVTRAFLSAATPPYVAPIVKPKPRPTNVKPKATTALAIVVGPSHLKPLFRAGYARLGLGHGWWEYVPDRRISSPGAVLFGRSGTKPAYRKGFRRRGLGDGWWEFLPVLTPKLSQYSPAT